MYSSDVCPEGFGDNRKRFGLVVSPDGLDARVIFNITAEELSRTSKDSLRNELSSFLDENGIVFGIDLSFLDGELVPGREYIAARGIRAVDGADAVIRMYELTETKPEVSESGKVDFYEMRLINRVKPGDWLGERIEPTDGTPGRTVRGEEIKPSRGKTAALSYDRNSVSEIRNHAKTILISKINGAVNYINGKIRVSNHLEIDGDAGVPTGNIKFDGYVTIKGTINDGYSVEATKDIEINSPYGLGNIKSLVSTQGSIFIKGGVSSKDRVEIKAAKNIYVKFADNCRIICGETAHIGYYSINSDIAARSVVFDSSNGQVIGGNIRAEIYICIPICGSEAERKTVLEVTGFNRQALVRRLDEVFHEISVKKAEQQKIKMQGPEASSTGLLAVTLQNRLFSLYDEIKALEEERKQIAIYLRTRGDGEISVTRRIYPNCSIILSGIFAQINADVMAQTFYLKDGEIKML